MSPVFKKIITSLIFASFLMVVFFSFGFMVHRPDGSMQGTCPLSSPAEESLCSQNTIFSAFHHISAYQSFLNIEVSFSVTIALILLLFLALVFIISLRNLNSVNQSLYFNRFYNTPPPLPGTKKIIRWLSLFEHSPSIA